MKCNSCNNRINLISWLLNVGTCEQCFWMKSDEEWKEINEFEIANKHGLSVCEARERGIII